MHPFRYHGAIKLTQSQGRIQGWATGAIASPKTYESIFIHPNFLQFGKQHSRYKPILSSIVLSQQCCEVYFFSLTIGVREFIFFGMQKIFAHIWSCISQVTYKQQVLMLRLKRAIVNKSRCVHA